MIYTTDPVEPSRWTYDKRYVWHAIECVRGREEAVRQIVLGDPAVRFAFYPSTVSQWTVRGKRYERTKAEVPGLVFARFDKWPNWTKLCERQLILRPFQVGERIMCFNPDSIRILRGLRSRAELMAEAQRQANLLRVGDAAQFAEGPLSALRLSVTGIDGDTVRFEFPGGLEGKTDARQLKKCAEGA